MLFIIMLAIIVLMYYIFEILIIKIRESDDLDWKDLYLIKLKLKLMNSREFEYFVASLYSLMGYRTEITQATRDGGVDVEVYDSKGNAIFIECKHYNEDKNSVVTRPIAQKLIGAVEYRKKKYNIKDARVAIFTTAGFTVDCLEYCKEMNIEIYDTNRILKLVNELNNSKVLLAAGIQTTEIRKDILNTIDNAEAIKCINENNIEEVKV